MSVEYEFKYITYAFEAKDGSAGFVWNGADFMRRAYRDFFQPYDLTLRTK
jgi:hypothetical protein